MFTGLVQEVGRIARVARESGSVRIEIEAPRLRTELRAGDSINVAGVCLTVVSLDARGFSADASPETLRSTTLADLAAGEGVNLERALRAGDPMGGHIVNGHVDAIAHILGREGEGGAHRMTIELPPTLRPYVVRRGSIAVDGVSLTVVDVEEEAFTVNLVPFTAQHTTLVDRPAGARVNLEVDVLAKYVETVLLHRRATAESRPGGIDEHFLAEHGYL